MTGNRISRRFAGLSKFLTAFVVIALIAVVAVMLTSGNSKRYVTVDFAQANSLYKASDVRILGVPVGRVESLTAKGDVVRVKLSYDAKYKLPENVKAVIVSPSVIGDRFVQLSPAYGGGKTLADNAVLGMDRTAVPVELDKIFESLDDLVVALGPKGANKNGSLSRFVDSQANLLDGQGGQLNETISNYSKLSQTLANNKDDLFGSVREVSTFVSMLKKNDASVRSFNDSTARVSTVLEGERQDLAGTLKALSLALIDVKSFVKDNRSALRGNIDNLTSLSEVLVKNKSSLEEAVKAAPTALSNLAFTYNGKYGTTDTRADTAKIFDVAEGDPGLLLCSLLGESGTNPGDICSTIGGILGQLPTDQIPLPRAAAASDLRSAYGNVNTSVRDMLAVN